MPSLVTHQLCALEAIQKCPEGLVQEAIKKFPEAFSVGSSGPDLLFFYKVFPIGKRSGQKEFYELGNTFHSKQINEVFDAALTLLKHSSRYTQEMCSYLAGWLCHYALDRVAHPYIFYRTGFGTQQSSNDHRRMEAMIDSLMIKEKCNQTLE